MTHTETPKVGFKSNPFRWLIVALIVMGLCFGGALVLLFLDSNEQDDKIDNLVALNEAQSGVVKDLCKRKSNDPSCKKAEELPEADEVVDGAEVQDPEIQEPEIQDPEVQDPEDQNSERQDAERQDAEQQDADPNDLDPIDDPDPDDPESQDPEIDDPDPNSMLNFAVDDSCTPPEGEYVTDVGLDVRRGDGTITYVIMCTTAPFTPGGGNPNG